MPCCSRPPTPYSVVFTDNATKLSWKADFLEAKKAAKVDLKSRRAASMRLSSARLTLHNLEFLHSLDLQPGRVGMKVCCLYYLPMFLHAPLGCLLGWSEHRYSWVYSLDTLHGLRARLCDHRNSQECDETTDVHVM